MKHQARFAMRFYVYRIFDLGGTIYVGKGSGRRLAKQISNFGALGEVVRRFRSEREAYAYERKMIAELKPSRNRCAGGGGSRVSTIVPRRTREEIEIERIGSRVYTARRLLNFQGIEMYLTPDAFATVKAVAASVV
jgi:hypothetical protein